VGGNRTTLRGAPQRGERPLGPPRLRVTAGAHEGEIFTLEDGETIIGKDADATIRLTDSGVSRRHAKLVRSSDGMVAIVDLRSTNGTFVNEARVEMAQLRAGYRIGIGPDAVLELDYGETRGTATRAPPAPASDPPLTARELDIARLVAEGLTNRDVADRLGIKPKTVGSHLDNIYARLGISSRAALTRWVLERGLG
jgi:DNA-binding CsgD family transcriptional regulator